MATSVDTNVTMPEGIDPKTEAALKQHVIGHALSHAAQHADDERKLQRLLEHAHVEQGPDPIGVAAVEALELGLHARVGPRGGAKGRGAEPAPPTGSGGERR